MQMSLPMFSPAQRLSAFRRISQIVVVSLLVITVSLTALNHEVRAEVKLPAVFGSHMVLQRDVAVPVWGWGAVGEEVTVTLREQSKTTAADAEGRWRVTLEPLAVGEAATLTVRGTNEIVLEDVLIGEVWVCSGQSNMGWSVSSSIDSDLEATSANHPQLRLFKVPNVSSDKPQQDVAASWTHCTPETVPGFTAVGYYFGRQVQQSLGVPVGLIQTAWGGTRAEAWTSEAGMASRPELQPILAKWKQDVAGYDAHAASEKHQAAMARWKDEVAKAKAEMKPLPRQPQAPGDPRLDRHHPSNLYNGMVAPLIPFAIRGAIWYQGESNASRAYQYRTLMPTMIQSWRSAWKQGDFPFYQVQLANYRAIQKDPVESDWAELREAQMLTIDAVPNVGVACITDIGAALDIHPKNKQDVGKRLARLALVDNYGFGTKIERNGPTYRSLDINGSQCIVHFEVGNSPLTTYYREPLQGFAIAGADKKWHWGTAKVLGKDSVEVSHPDVPEPVAVRYNWADNPQGNLYNDLYLPAYPFRSDDWPGVTVENLSP